MFLADIDVDRMTGCVDFVTFGRGGSIRAYFEPSRRKVQEAITAPAVVLWRGSNFATANHWDAVPTPGVAAVTDVPAAAVDGSCPGPAADATDGCWNPGCATASRRCCPAGGCSADADGPADDCPADGGHDAADDNSGRDDRPGNHSHSRHRNSHHRSSRCRNHRGCCRSRRDNPPGSGTAWTGRHGNTHCRRHHRHCRHSHTWRSRTRPATGLRQRSSASSWYGPPRVRSPA